MILSLLQDPITLIGFLLAIIIGLTIHEFAHAWAAFKLGDYTAKYAGRLSLNPSKHIDPIGLIFLLLAGFGWGKPVPVNPNALRNKYDDLKVSLAGPASNLIVAFAVSIPYFYLRNILKIGVEQSDFVKVLEIVMTLNIWLMIFNLIPIPPLDGHKILTSIAPYSWRERLRSMEHMGMIILLILLFTGILHPLMTWVTRLVLFVFSSIVMFVNEIIVFIISIF